MYMYRFYSKVLAVRNASKVFSVFRFNMLYEYSHISHGLHISTLCNSLFIRFSIEYYLNISLTTYKNLIGMIFVEDQDSFDLICHMHCNCIEFVFSNIGGTTL